MKKNIFSLQLFLPLLALVFLSACQDQELLFSENINQETSAFSSSLNSVKPGPILTEKEVPENTISLATFNEWNTNWETHWKDNYISNFTMPLSNLQNVINTSGVEAARFYLGYSEQDREPHLSLVGVNSTGESMISSNDFIYNFTRPCPHACPTLTPAGTVFPSSGLDAAPANTISLATFDDWNEAWTVHWADSYISNFTMPLSNLQNLVNTTGVVEARLFLGYSKADGQAHLTLVGVDANGMSMVGTNAHIYNYTVVCPPFCDK